MIASMGEILDSDYSAFLPLLIFFSLSLSTFSPQVLAYLRLANLGPACLQKPLVALSWEGCVAM